jgi:hypothetical protein
MGKICTIRYLDSEVNCGMEPKTPNNPAIKAEAGPKFDREIRPDVEQLRAYTQVKRADDGEI